MSLAKFFKYPFAVSGTRTTIPDPIQVAGTVSYTEGFGFDYERDYPTDTLAKTIPRSQTNELFYQISLAIQQYQTLGFPDFITTTDNGGTAYSYSINATVRYDDGTGFKNYYSLVDANTALPSDTTKWGRVVYTSGEESCVVKEYWGSDLPVGYVWANGTTIGDASSGATGRANADTVVAFTRLWNATSNTVFPIKDSSGAATTRGLTAAADFAAHKQLPVPDRRDVTTIGKTDMGGLSARGLVLQSDTGIAVATLGAIGGMSMVALTSNQNGTHTHTFTGSPLGSHSHSMDAQVSNNGGVTSLPAYGNIGAVQVNAITTKSASAGTPAGTNSNSGLGEAHQNMQPTLVCNFIMKL
jgi:microcystin-dependent protein